MLPYSKERGVVKLGNIVTYGEEVLDTFDRRGFGPGDSLILSWASYLKLSTAEPRKAT